MKGYVQVYTGNGKGKTTAALGLALRAAGAGMRVFIAQFAKGMNFSELKSIERFSETITIKQYGRSSFIRDKAEPEDIELARKGHLGSLVYDDTLLFGRQFIVFHGWLRFLLGLALLRCCGKRNQTDCDDYCQPSPHHQSD